MPILKINDISMYYETHGQGDPLVFVAGFGADHLGWTPIVDAFSAEYQVILLDNRGVGQSDVPQGPYSIAQMAKDVIDLCDRLQISKAHFIGNSMGGYIVQTIAHQFSSRVKSIVISNSGMETRTPFHIYVKAHLELQKASAPQETLMKAMCSWAFSYSFLQQESMLNNLIAWGKSNPYPFSITGYEAQYAALDAFDSRAWAKEICVPTFVLAGNEDIILSPALSKALVAEIQHAEFYQFDDCGHLPHIEYPRKYAQVVRTFLQKNR